MLDFYTYLFSRGWLKFLDPASKDLLNYLLLAKNHYQSSKIKIHTEKIKNLMSLDKFALAKEELIVLGFISTTEDEIIINSLQNIPICNFNQLSDEKLNEYKFFKKELLLYRINQGRQFFWQKESEKILNPNDLRKKYQTLNVNIDKIKEKSFMEQLKEIVAIYHSNNMDLEEIIKSLPKEVQRIIDTYELWFGRKADEFDIEAAQYLAKEGYNIAKITGLIESLARKRDDIYGLGYFKAFVDRGYFQKRKSKSGEKKTKNRRDVGYGKVSKAEGYHSDFFYE